MSDLGRGRGGEHFAHLAGAIEGIVVEAEEDLGGIEGFERLGLLLVVAHSLVYAADE